MKVSIEKFSVDNMRNGLEFAVESEIKGERKPARAWITKDGILIGPGRTEPENSVLYRWDTLLEIAALHSGVDKKDHRELNIVDTMLRTTFNLDPG